MWFLFSIIAALSTAFGDVLTKHGTSKFNSYIISWALMGFSLIILVPLLLLTGIPTITSTYWLAFTILLILDLSTLYMYVYALKVSPISLTIPMLSLTPLFIVITSFFINKELPSLTGIIGIILIVAGAYLLHFDHISKKIWSPFYAIVKERGTLLMTIVAILWGITGSFHKLAIHNSSALFHGIFETLILALISLPIAYYSSPTQFKSVIKKNNLKFLLPLGILNAVAVISQMLATSFTFAAYPVAIKRTSILFSSLLAFYFFKEKNEKRLLPIGLMVLGVICITLF